MSQLNEKIGQFVDELHEDYDLDESLKILVESLTEEEREELKALLSKHDLHEF